MKMPKLSSVPMTVPTSDNCGRSTPRSLGGAGSASATATGADAGGGLRDAEKIGRSRVFDNVVSGMPHSGLALFARSVSAGCATTGLTSIGGAGAGSSHSEIAGRLAALYDGSGSASGAMVNGAADDGMTSAETSNTVNFWRHQGIVPAPIILRPAIVRRR